MDLKDIRKLYGLKELPKHTSNKKKLEMIQQRFYNRHVCPLCHNTMKHIEGTNVMVCGNPDCKGADIKVSKDKRVKSSPSHLLDSKGAAIANSIFYD